MSQPQRLIVDTNVLSYIFKEHSLAQVYQPLIAGTLNAISFQTLAELLLWAEKSRWGERRRTELTTFLESFPVIHSDPLICAQWSALCLHARRAGRPIDPADAWIAATALAVGCPLVTHNAADFTGVPGLSIVTASGS